MDAVTFANDCLSIEKHMEKLSKRMAVLAFQDNDDITRHAARKNQQAVDRMYNRTNLFIISMKQFSMRNLENSQAPEAEDENAKDENDQNEPGPSQSKRARLNNQVAQVAPAVAAPQENEPDQDIAPPDAVEQVQQLAVVGHDEEPQQNEPDQGS